MASLGQRFDATQHDTTQSDYAELPNGIYKLEIEASDVAPTKNGNGTLLKTTMTVVLPDEYNGRKLFTSFNLENQSAQAQEIGQKQFASLCRALGIDSVEESEELHFVPFFARVGLGKPSKDGQYPARAEIKRYFYPDEGEPPEPAVEAGQPAASPRPGNDNRRSPAPQARVTTNDNRPAPAGTRPWSRKAA